MGRMSPPALHLDHLPLYKQQQQKLKEFTFSWFDATLEHSTQCNILHRFRIGDFCPPRMKPYDSAINYKI